PQRHLIAISVRNIRAKCYLWLYYPIKSMFYRILYGYLLLMALPWLTYGQSFRQAVLDLGEVSGIMVHNVAEDSKGLIWFSTYNGLFRYDGQQTMRLTESIRDLGFRGN